MLPDKKHNQTIGITIKEVLLDEKYNWTIEIKCCQTKRLLELRIIKCYQMKMLLDEKYNWTIEIKCYQMKRLLKLKIIKVKKLLPDEKHDWTIGIKFCQMRNMTRLLELSIAE
ncbi:hypothetical protein RclHR1_14220001 [Rhizophagus clarus]|uniref:Uncharacterized protein n=1 Tax=Rhizophagus clarus TaxID=94130 RepID=A0A2Z6QGG7_9GLOM|nr:hypothetical protein RclHR1_14220001 [Rhizophagus clarus]